MRSRFHLCRGAVVRAGFTLIELLVVMGVIGLLLGLLVSLWRSSDQTVALEAGQRTLSALVSLARGEALARQAECALLVATVPGQPETHLRELVVAVNVGAGANPEWLLIGAPSVLPVGVYLTPAVDPMPTGPGAPGAVTVVTSGSAWPSEARSAWAGATTARRVEGSVGYPALVGPRFLASGELARPPTAARGQVLVLMAGRPTAEGGVEFSNPRNVRGVVLSDYGLPQPINGLESLPPATFQ